MRKRTLGDELRDEGMAAVLANDSEFTKKAQGIIYEQFWKTGRIITGEWPKLMVMPILGRPHKSQKWGALINSFVRKKEFIPLEMRRKSEGASNHSRKVAIYEMADLDKVARERLKRKRNGKPHQQAT